VSVLPSLLSLQPRISIVVQNNARLLVTVRLAEEFSKSRKKEKKEGRGKKNTRSLTSRNRRGKKRKTEARTAAASQAEREGRRQDWGGGRTGWDSNFSFQFRRSARFGPLRRGRSATPKSSARARARARVRKNAFIALVSARRRL